jgi:hypothetical protein
LLIVDPSIVSESEVNMENGKSRSSPTIGLVLIAWGLVCLGAAFFIPHYDFGFDGVKIWICICLLMLAVLLGGRWGFMALARR